MSDNKHSLSGTLIVKGEPYSVGDGRLWKLDFELRTKDRFPVDVQFQLVGENIELIKNFCVMDEIRVSFSINGYRGNKRLFNNLNVYYIEPFGANINKKKNNNYKPSFGNGNGND